MTSAVMVSVAAAGTAGGYAARPTPPSRVVAPDADVLAGLSIRRGAEEQPRPRFGDDVWDLLPAVHNPSVRHCTLNFGCVAAPDLRLAAKELVYARLHTPVGRQRRANPRSAHALLHQDLRVALGYLTERHGAHCLAGVTAPALNAFAAHVRASGRSPRAKQALVQAVRLLWAYRAHLSDGGLRERPWRGRVVTHLTGTARRGGGPAENTTPRVPEAVMGPYLRWALRYVTEFAPEIESALRRQLAAPAPVRGRAGGDGGRGRGGTLDDAFAAYAAALRAAGQGLPDLSPCDHGYAAARASGDPAALVNYAAVAAAVGCGSPSVYARSAWVAATCAAVGLEGDRARADRPESLTGLLGHRLAGRALLLEVVALRAACYVVVTFLSGMRYSEVASLRRGCLEVERAHDGTVRRYRLRGLVFKDEVPEGREDTWVVTRPVADAVAVLERLHAAAGAAADAPLFQGVYGAQTARNPWRGGSAIKQLNRFRDRVNALAARSARTPAVPEYEGRAWAFTSNQFRRTLAWYLVNQPFGVVAGALQFKHVRIATFQGYGGTRAAGFRDEVEREELRHKLTLARDLYDDHVEGRPSAVGGGAKAVADALEAIRAEIGSLPGRVEHDERRLMRRLTAVAAMLHVGIVNDCFYREETALCKPWQAQPGVPTFARCQPDLCPNSRIDARHRPAWERAHDNADAMLRRAGQAGRALPVNQALALEADRARYRRVLGLLDTLVAEDYADVDPGPADANPTTDCAA